MSSEEGRVRLATAMLYHPTMNKFQVFDGLRRDQQIEIAGLSARHGRLGRGMTYILPDDCREDDAKATAFVDAVLAAFPDLQRTEPGCNAICRKEPSP